MSLGQAEEGIIDPEGEEEEEAGISYSQVEHVDVGVSPGGPFGDECMQSSSIDQETQEKHCAVSQTLKGIHFASGDGNVGDVAHIYLKEVSMSQSEK